jgi:hypothetical protein
MGYAVESRCLFKENAIDHNKYKQAHTRYEKTFCVKNFFPQIFKKKQQRQH